MDREQINNLVSLKGKEVVEMAAGTGLLTKLLTEHAKQVQAFDISEEMLAVNQEHLEKCSVKNCKLSVAENKSIPLPDNTADVVIEGWSLGYMVAKSGTVWEKEIDKVLAEMERLLKPNGMILIFGTLGTGAHKPAPPNKELANLYEYLENKKGFSVTPWFKTDYEFDSVDQAVELISFFWSNNFGEYIKTKQSLIVEECTAIWYKKY
ncbi:class I SAM-dependent methyltransferase [Pseudofulvibacter geojedonensis]|uniref:Class I SAM-dependent methyltransferase n=1 Tax=Pseudofulvibacter geojedonensis TaxID=1123758 RepID=A0ABW3I2G9_9FLAO